MEDVSFGTWQELLDRRQCRCCEKILRHFKKSGSWSAKFPPSSRLKLEKGHDIDEFELRLVSYVFRPLAGISADILPKLDSPDNESDIFSLSLTPMEIYGKEWPAYLPINQVQLDIPRLIRWSEYCGRHHQGKCHELLQWESIPSASSLIFIDVQDNCLVQISEQLRSRYLALSYVWGKSSGSIQLTTRNLSQLCTRNSLQLQNRGLNIPKTISDAMVLTRSMGLRYLWVDRLCIIQDDPTHLTKQLQQMAGIYAHSHFTIIAADGSDADYGLYGIDSESSPRSIVYEPFEFTANVKMMKTPGGESMFDKPFWHTRAWTFQERAISRRTLVFTENTVYWQCRNATWYEQLAAEPEGMALRVKWRNDGWPSYSVTIDPWPTLERYFKLVEGYNHRNLTFESDAVHGFKAITTALTKSFPGGFYFGLPVFLFDLAMMWTGNSPLSRRNDFPSWSWLGWNGEVKLPSGYAEAWNPDFNYRPLVVDIKPLVDWYALNADKISYYLIDNSYHQYKADLRDPTYSPPEGWNKTWNEEDEAEAVQHKDLPNYLFKFPFPIFPSIKDDTPHDCFPYLKFEAQSCTLLLDDSFTSDVDEEVMTVNLRDGQDHWAGVVESLFVGEDQYSCGTSCELIAISKGRAKRDSDFSHPFGVAPPFKEMDRIQEIKSLEEYVFINVLWIEWVGDVAYRKAMGRVWEMAWERQNVKSINVVLG